jgi:2-haloacid dehalogenase
MVEVLVFDVFGTVVDWRGSLARELEGLLPDPAGFADQWRGEYKPSMDRVRRGAQPWTGLDALHRESLDRLLGDRLPDEATRDRLVRAWHRLTPWPDAVAGLARLKRRYIIATLSNGNVSLLVDLAKHAGLPWDMVLSAELFGHYKPDPEVYRGAASLLGRAPGQVMLVAAHNGDLLAAQREGLGTAFVPRPREHGPGQTTDLAPEHDFDVVAKDFGELAEKLGC